jgi:hypothetical protein
MAKKTKVRPETKSSAPAAVATVAPRSAAKFALGVTALHVFLMALAFNPTIFTGGDNGVYVALSRALVEQGRYISLHDPGLAPHTYYPPGYPLILALASIVGIHPWVPIKLVTVAFCALGVAFSCLWLRRKTTPGVALFAALILAMSPGLLLQGQLELSDVPFWGLVMVALWAFEGLPRDDWRRVLVAGAMCALAYLTRSAALPLIAAAFAWLAFERRWRQVLLFAAVILPVVGFWTWWKSANGAADLTYGQYANTFWLKDHYAPELGRASLADVFLRRPLENTNRYAGTMIPLLLVQRTAAPLLLLGLGLGAAAVIGWARRIRTPGMTELFFPMYGGMLLLLPPVWAGERYLFPIFPLALGYASETVKWAVSIWRPSALRPVAASVLLVIIALAIAPMARIFATARTCTVAYLHGQRYACLSAEWQDYLGMAEWSRSNLPADAVLISRKPGLFFALSDRRGIDIPKTTDVSTYIETARRAGARFVILDRIDALTELYSIPVVTTYPELFCIFQPGATAGTALLGIRFDQPIASSRLPTAKVTLDPCPEVAPP